MFLAAKARMRALGRYNERRMRIAERALVKFRFVCTKAFRERVGR